MALRLGELLMNEKLFTRAQLEEALQAQAVFGGRLGTILLEMGAVGELDLLRVLSRQMGVPFASPDQLVNIPRAALDALTPEMATKYQCLPIHLEGRRLTVVMVNPRDLRAIDELSFRSGYVIRPILAPELRLGYALQYYYRLPRKSREMVPHEAVREQLARLERGGSEAASPIAAPDPLRAAEPDLADLGGDLTAPETTPAGGRGNGQPAASRPEHTDSPAGGAGIPTPAARSGERGARSEATLQNTARQLAAVQHQDDVAEALIFHLGARYSRAALFKVTGEQAVGWRSSHRGQPLPGFLEARLPLTATSVLQDVVAHQGCFTGPIPADLANRPLLHLLGPPAPAAALLLPLSMRNRVVAMIYVDDPQINPSQVRGDIQQLAVKALLAFEMLILKNKILGS